MARRARLPVALLVAFCLTLPAATSTADRQLEAAIYREMVEMGRLAPP